MWTESQTPVKTLPWPNFVVAGVKFSLTPHYGMPRGVNHNAFIVMVCPGGANHNDKSIMINPPLLWLTPPFVMDYRYCDIE